ncbi:neurofilament heavy polypeptide-like [Patagioenas fasciata monilis]|uniref:Neurofilament heavy polypeptide-like n=1 Tax=Patagioenas fasciata monilis TaxID=372326 RepID=A0A1V4JV50_PATFA|nr:neurofilament heavy polypeptide-like [Patagioenas fasciata monilis]
MELTEPQGAVAKTAPAPPVEERPPRPRLGELVATNVTPSSVQLRWSVPEGAFDSFTVQYRGAQGQPQALAVDGGSRTVTVTGLSPSRRYKFNLYGLWGRKRVGLVSTDAVTGEGDTGTRLWPPWVPGALGGSWTPRDVGPSGH